MPPDLKVSPNVDLLILSILLYYWQIFFHKIEIFLIIWGHLFSIKKQFLLERHVKCFFLFLYYFQIKELISIATRTQFLESFCNISINRVSTFQESLVVVELNRALKCSHTAQTCNQNIPPNIVTTISVDLSRLQFLHLTCKPKSCTAFHWTQAVLEEDLVYNRTHSVTSQKRVLSKQRIELF